MIVTVVPAGSRLSGHVRAALALAFLLHALGANAHAQTNSDEHGFAVRELSVSSGYTAVQLPPITLGGILPIDGLDEDLISSGAADITWRRATPRTEYMLELSGTYTARARFMKLSAPGGNLTFHLSRALGRRWRLGAAVANAITNSDQLAYQPTQARRLVEDAGSFGDLSGAVALARSTSPDLSQAMLFLPIAQSLSGSDLYGTRALASSVRADATYAHSPRLETELHGNYTAVREISATDTSAQVLPFPDSSTESAGFEIRYDRSERTQVTAAFDWSRTSGTFTDETVIAAVGYGWSGRKWFTAGTVGAALQPFPMPAAPGPVTTIRDRTPAIVGSAAVGYKFQAQTLFMQYSRATHDEFGAGGRNIATGFEGNVQTVGGSWLWSAPRGHWTAELDFSMIRRPGNFSYIYAWLSTIGIGRQLGRNVRLMGEVLFDRHGSRAFEGFQLTREGARLNLVWTPRRRPAL